MKYERNDTNNGVHLNNDKSIMTNSHGNWACCNVYMILRQYITQYYIESRWSVVHRHCNTLQRIATYCSTLEHTATHKQLASSIKRSKWSKGICRMMTCVIYFYHQQITTSVIYLYNQLPSPASVPGFGKRWCAGLGYDIEILYQKNKQFKKKENTQ